ncbi:FAD-dependent oxidoreductase [Dehalogenimonas alkenigignens]|uniref:FAD-dependent oxidoreductase n=1 Tax=Dehalogenimonas alkenigignens TaxID=1217799 RepID=UPI001F0BDE4F|nr:FAD-dependent oxidoreductase [Dehalogenimonas alkenigignens]
MEKTKIGAALVVGGGVGGMQTALDLAEAGIKVYLLDEAPAIGGKMVQLDKTFPTNDCAMCTVSPRLVSIDRHLNIELLTNSKVLGYEGEAGNFRINVLKKARCVDISKCTGCNVCIEKCPTKTASEFDRGLAKRKAIYTPYAQAVPNVPIIDKDNCIYFKKGKGCKACEKFCEAGAIMLEQQDEVVEINVGAVVLAPGYDLYDATEKPQLGFGRYPDVLTSLQFERMLSASGPFAGKVMRPSSGALPKKVAFIQCVGSRETSADFCSAVCCMYATKEALILKEHHPEIDVAVFYIDIRAYGKGFEVYYERAKKAGVRYIRCQPSSLKQVPSSKDIVVRYQDEQGRLLEEYFEMVMLSCGLRPSKAGQSVSDTFGVRLNSDGFCFTEGLDPVATNIDGIYAVGAFTGPKDIPETVIQAGAAASRVLALLSEKRGELLQERTYPDERPVDGAEPRTGVFVCHCGKNIASVVSIPEVVEYARTLPHVGYVNDTLFACATDAGEKIKEAIIEHGLNRVVIAACTPRTHEGLFQDTLREAGLNPYLLEIANIRNQCSWVHMHQPAEATAKAKDIIRLAAVKVSHLRPLHPGHVSVSHDGLVIGGGLAGMMAALGLADAGYKTYLLEKGRELGGNLRRVKFGGPGEEPQAKLKELVERIRIHPNIELHLESKVTAFDGTAGNFIVDFKTDGEIRQVKAGAVIVATGAVEYMPTEYLYGQSPRVITQLDLEERVSLERIDARTVVMIQCVGSRDEKHPYCSRLCCVQAIKNAIKLKARQPKTEVFILYRDIRAYSLHEAEYTRARKLGVRFIRYEQNQPPVASQNGTDLVVSVVDPILNARLKIPTDLLVLSTGVVPDEDQELARMLKLPQSEDGFLMEAHIKLRPVDSPVEGVFLAGLAHSPKLADESIAQAGAAAAKAAAILSKEEIRLEACVSEVKDENCDGCAYCVDPCPFKAINLVEYMSGDAVKKTAETDPAKCQGCGVCMATCPKKGIMVKNFNLDELSEMVAALVSPV